MDYFKSMLSGDPEPENPDNHEKSDTDHRPNQPPTHQKTESPAEYTNLNSSSSIDTESGGGSLWSFGDLVKTLTTRSESVLETYRRDLKEFSSGLRKESDLFREVASRAVKELPTSIEVGASAIDGVLKSTADIISQGKEAFLDENTSDPNGLNSRGYNRFDSQLNSIQSDARTYCEDPEDLDDYNYWKSGFVLSGKEIEIEKVIADNGSVESIYRKIVPNEVDDESFWCRYFYRVHKLKQQEDMRASLVRRSLTVDEEEELSWDVDEEEDEEEEKDLPEIKMKRSSNHDLDKNTNAAFVKNNNTESSNSKPSRDVSDQKDESVPKSNEQIDCSKIVSKDGVEDLDKSDTAVHKMEEPKPSGGIVCDDKVVSVPKTKENEVVGLSTHVSFQEEDLEWDEIGDLGDNDEQEASQFDTARKGQVFKQLSTAEDDEDLSWDIEDDDEPIKGSGESNFLNDSINT